MKLRSMWRKRRDVMEFNDKEKASLVKQEILQALHDENVRLGLYDDVYAVETLEQENRLLRARNDRLEKELAMYQVQRLGQEIQPEHEPVAWVYPEGLEALKAGKPWTAYGTRQEPNNTALYLSPQPDIAPYAWVTFTPYGDEDDVWYENPEGQLLEGWTYKPLYDTTPPQRTWVDLTEAEIDEICLGDEAKVRTALKLIKEKNT